MLSVKKTAPCLWLLLFKINLVMPEEGHILGYRESSNFGGEGESKGITEYDYYSCYLFCLHTGVTMEWLEIVRKWKRNIDNYFT
jgi:hypothetical protein